jgi:hypothetical protein
MFAASGEPHSWLFDEQSGCAVCTAGFLTGATLNMKDGNSITMSPRAERTSWPAGLGSCELGQIQWTCSWETMVLYVA